MTTLLQLIFSSKRRFTIFSPHLMMNTYLSWLANINAIFVDVVQLGHILEPANLVIMIIAQETFPIQPKRSSLFFILLILESSLQWNPFILTNKLLFSSNAALPDLKSTEHRQGALVPSIFHAAILGRWVYTLLSGWLLLSLPFCCFWIITMF